ncbi:hypothetical protein [Massilia sp. YIM B04103]|uniref:hypothetical protein n=1 Tax=Massilia sp. YIM B04103 TaxID=2963106 RepID=UPI00210E2FC6|nr:hypothetical protein [Massilia sp. YIM B04103]
MPDILTSDHSPDQQIAQSQSGDIPQLEHTVAELRLAITTFSEFRRADLELARKRHAEIVRRLDALESGVASKSELTVQFADLRQRVNDIQAMESSLRDMSLQTIKASFQSEASVVEQKISLGSQQRYAGLESKVEKAEFGLQGKIDRSEISVQSKIAELKTSVEAQIKGVDQTLEAKIRGQVIQGIVWGMGLVGGVIAITFALLKHLSS